MTPDERKLLAELFDRVQSASANRRDPEAEAFIAEKVRAQPYAPYLLAQAVIVQEEGLKNAATRIEQLERELADAKAQPSGGGSFLGSIFGGGGRDSAPAPQQQPGGPWGYQRGGSVPSVSPQQSGGWGGQPMQQQPMQQQPQGGSFLRGALGTAAGVAGGVMLANSLSGLFSGQNNKHGIAGDTAGSSGATPASQDDSAITGGIFDDKPSSGGGGHDPDPQPASYDDGGGWESGGGDDSYDA
ncbi:MAG: putative periplasmic ligand binding sensor protein [Hyphomicrobiales bacterium]|nr:putative periplasmic ligand binding sensor protein [Hyphomicrobiales bacterium]